MTMEKVCAALSALVSNDNKNQETRGHASLRHRPDLPMPAGWSRWTDTQSSHPATLGLGGSAFVHAAGNQGEGDGTSADAVLAFPGPDFFGDALGDPPDPHEPGDADEFAVNLALDIGLASFADAMAAATHLYGRVRQWMHDEGRAPGRIVFTGHGVGGGIASVMAVWFDQPCIAFAQAPLRAVALSPSDFARARDVIESMPGDPTGANANAAAARALRAFIRHPREVLAQREHLRVSHWHVQGEIFERLRSPATAIQGAAHTLDIGAHTLPPTPETALALHAMKLHAALLYDPRLPALFRQSPALLPLLLLDREDQGEELLDSLINDQHRAGLEAESGLQRFVTGLELPIQDAEDPTRGRGPAQSNCENDPAEVGG